MQDNCSVYMQPAPSVGTKPSDEKVMINSGHQNLRKKTRRVLYCISLFQINFAGVQSDIVITARNKRALDETKTLILSQAPGVNVHVVPGDLSDMASLPTLCTQILDLVDTSKQQQGVLIHNAATMNEFIPFLSQNDPKKIQAYLNTNVTSMIVLTTRFLSIFPTGQHYVIHITAILATNYCKWYSLYSTAKAARTAFMGSILEELPEVRQFNYSPGPCDTDMLKEIPADKFSVDGQPIHVLTAEESIQKMVKVLKEDQYENGCTIDYFNRKC